MPLSYSLKSREQNGRPNAPTPEMQWARETEGEQDAEKSITLEQTLTHFWAVFPGRFQPPPPFLLLSLLQLWAGKSPPSESKF